MGPPSRLARREHKRLVLLEVRQSNGPAIALYRSVGFETTGVRRGYYSDTGEDALEMRVTLDPKSGEAVAPKGAGLGLIIAGLCMNGRNVRVEKGFECQGARYGLAVLLRYAEHAQRRRAMIGKIAVNIGPASVAARIEAHDGVLRG